MQNGNKMIKNFLKKSSIKIPRTLYLRWRNRVNTKVKPHLKGDEVKKGINTAIVHKVTNEQFIRSYVTDLSNYPHEDESFIAALFIVLLKDIDPSKIMEIYKDIKERKTMFKSMEDLQTFY